MNATELEKSEFKNLVDHYLVQHVQIIEAKDGRVRWGMMNMTMTSQGYMLGEPIMITEVIFADFKKAMNNARETLRKIPEHLDFARSNARDHLLFNRKK
ncbi:MAG: hypothetical protein ACEQSD_06780 [Flavobacteriales bacterium]